MTFGVGSGYGLRRIYFPPVTHKTNDGATKRSSIDGFVLRPARPSKAANHHRQGHPRQTRIQPKPKTLTTTSIQSSSILPYPVGGAMEATKADVYISLSTGAKGATC